MIAHNGRKNESESKSIRKIQINDYATTETEIGQKQKQQERRQKYKRNRNSANRSGITDEDIYR